ncbi:hypothetical protein [Xenorhabdus bovienii]|uniref:hypothetical protein n=1 Tax=Xenorhabdus bovienii TaxID=40576 RepID=UPI0023B285C8|nr:hypothetical protein [Xenorhabdus bovienii]MDE9459716.1 hypothetical protein [Xenorhabdus bovienii]MDE9463466.1 hypothetical protein [Xenorhabdus bovienii]MDE9471235.1 hypothetical protein [Xenorhabdus bovienii]MDE9488098.1 hypothetical protein [Xenorhabdus bovienii]MDE9516045.1 hypothetical protein [Xenorhabdus bovienii]
MMKASYIKNDLPGIFPDRVLRFILFAEYDHRDGQRLTGAQIPSGKRRPAEKNRTELLLSESA